MPAKQTRAETGPVTALTWAQVLAWRLAQHHLLERAPRAHMLDVVAQIGGLHAQVLSAAELALAVRVDDPALADVRDALWGARSLVKTWAMRGTLHLLPAREYGLYVAALRTKTGYLRPAWLKYFGVTAGEMAAILDGVRAALDGPALTREELAVELSRRTGSPHIAAALRSGWGTLLKPAAYQGTLCFGPSQGQAVTFVRPDRWIGPWPEQDSAAALGAMLRRFLTAYGPATRDDFARWWGVETREVRPVFAALAAELTEVTVEGWPALALAATVPQMQALPPPAGVRLLPAFDPYVIGLSRDCPYVLPAVIKPRISRAAGWISPVVLIAGEIAGIWQYEKRRGRLAVEVELFAPQPAAVQAQIAAEAERLGAFLAAPVDLVYRAAPDAGAPPPHDR